MYKETEDKISSVTLNWARSGSEPVGITNYRLKIKNSLGQEIIVKNQIPITQTKLYINERRSWEAKYK